MSKLIKLVSAAGATTLALSGCAVNEMPGYVPSGAPSGSETASALSGTLDGSGASSMAAGQEAWVAAFQQAYPGVTVNYNPTGSGTGRDQFEEGLTFFTGSDSYFSDEELAAGHLNCSPENPDLFEFPVWISPIAVFFNLEGIDSLNMSADTIAGIFAGEITSWRDSAITKDNPGVELPDISITAVHRSDESGTTGNFTDWLAKAAPSTWVLNGENVGSTEKWPAEFGGEGAQGTSGVVAAVAAGQGTIGYADASRAADFGTVAVGVGDQFVPFSPEAAAKIVDVSSIKLGRPATTVAYELARDTNEAGVYPVVLVSYLQGCMDYLDDAKAELVKAYANFLISAEGQYVASVAAGNAPISQGTRAIAQSILDQVR